MIPLHIAITAVSQYCTALPQTDVAAHSVGAAVSQLVLYSSIKLCFHHSETNAKTSETPIAQVEK